MSKISTGFFAVWNDEDHERLSNGTSVPGKHYTFAEKLRDALRHSDSYCTDSTDDSYAVDISISGSKTDADEGIRFECIPPTPISVDLFDYPLLIGLGLSSCLEFDEAAVVVSY